MTPRLPKYHPDQIRRTKSISISIPLELEPLINQAAAHRGMNRSEYLSWLAVQHIYLSRGQLPPEPLLQNLPPLPKTPLRIRKKQS